MGWKNIKIEEIAGIGKCVAELLKTPYSKFKVKVFESQRGGYTRYTNLLIKDNPGAGSLKNIEGALEEIIKNFLDIVNENLGCLCNSFRICFIILKK